MANNPLLVGNNTWRSALTGGTGSWVGLPTAPGPTAPLGSGAVNPLGLGGRAPRSALGALPALASGAVPPSGVGGGTLKALGRSPLSQSPLAAALAGY